LVDFIADKFVQLHAVDLRTDPVACAQLWRDAQDAKHTLSARQQTVLVVEYEGHQMRLDLHRSDFEQLIGALIDRTEMTTRLMLNDAGLDWPQIDHVILTGGSTRIPAIGTMLERISGKTLDRSLSPDEAVAHGAALYASMLLKKHCDHSGDGCGLVNVNSHSLGLIGRDKKTGRKVVSVLIPKNTALPCTASETFELAKDNQQTILAGVVEGDSRRPEDCVSLGELVLRNLPPGLSAKTLVHVEFSYSPSGLLKVSARIPKARRTADVEIQRLQTERIEDLLLWRTRLLAGASVVGTGVDPGKNPFSEPSSVNDAHERLSGLYRVVGENAVGQSLPWRLSIQKRATAKAVASLAQLRGALKEMEEVNETAITHADKIYAMGKLSQCRQKYREAECHTTKLLAAFGCKCAVRNLVLPGTKNEAEEIRRLREWLANAEDSRSN
jgi:molecular chaperone DnaK (HSP70)